MNIFEKNSMPQNDPRDPWNAVLTTQSKMCQHKAQNFSIITQEWMKNKSFFEKTFSLNRSHGHEECGVDNPVEKLLTERGKYFAEGPIKI